MKNTNLQKNGFTLVETLIAVLILTISIGGLLSLAAGGFFSVRYSRNQIIANSLLQESIEYVRNTRDTSFLQGRGWGGWKSSLNVDGSGNLTGGSTDGCFSSDGCIVDPYTSGNKIKACSGTCPNISYYPDNSFYGYSNSYPFTITNPAYQTSFVRTIKLTPSSVTDDQVIVTASISWLNGTNTKIITQKDLITNWTP